MGLRMSSEEINLGKILTHGNVNPSYCSNRFLTDSYECFPNDREPSYTWFSQPVCCALHQPEEHHPTAPRIDFRDLLQFAGLSVLYVSAKTQKDIRSYT